MRSSTPTRAELELEYGILRKLLASGIQEVKVLVQVLLLELLGHLLALLSSDFLSLFDNLHFHGLLKLHLVLLEDDALLYPLLKFDLIFVELFRAANLIIQILMRVLKASRGILGTETKEFGARRYAHVGLEGTIFQEFQLLLLVDLQFEGFTFFTGPDPMVIERFEYVILA